MSEVENENAVPEPRPDYALEADIAADAVPREMGYPDAREELAEVEEPVGSDLAAAPDGIGVQTQSGMDGARGGPPATRAGGNHASGDPRPAEDQERLMAGVISRIERLENWVKTNRLG
jgi:hypothetical protein